MPQNLLSSEPRLRRRLKEALFSQGYGIDGRIFRPGAFSREEIRDIHRLPRAKKIIGNIQFIERFMSKAEKFMRDSSEIDIQKIKPRLILITTKEKELWRLFRWWNLVWWSLPYEKSYGRQMRFLVWDDCHNAPIGLIGLQSPLLSWSPRDKYLDIRPKGRDILVNQSMNAQRLGALPPYNKFLGGKLVASLMASSRVRKSFAKKYKGYKTILLKRKLPSRLLFITTTGAYGKSSVYNRLKDSRGEKICEFIGSTSGSGSFHIPDSIYEELILYLKEQGLKAGRSFGNGPSVKMKNITQAMRLLGFQKGSSHGIERSVYLFRFAKNLENVISRGSKPLWHNREIDDITDYWKKRWAVKRLPKNCPKEKTHFSKKEHLSEVKEDLDKCKKLIERSFP